MQQSGAGFSGAPQIKGTAGAIPYIVNYYPVQPITVE